MHIIIYSSRIFESFENRIPGYIGEVTRHRCQIRRGVIPLVHAYPPRPAYFYKVPARRAIRWRIFHPGCCCTRTRTLHSLYSIQLSFHARRTP